MDRERKERLKSLALRPGRAMGYAIERSSGQNGGGGEVTLDDDSLWL